MQARRNLQTKCLRGEFDGTFEGRQRSNFGERKRFEVTFNRDDAKANLFITLSAADADTHLQVLVKISELLQDEDKAAKILNAADVNELYGYFAD